MDISAIFGQSKDRGWILNRRIWFMLPLDEIVMSALYLESGKGSTGSKPCLLGQAKHTKNRLLWVLRTFRVRSRQEDPSIRIRGSSTFGVTKFHRHVCHKGFSSQKGSLGWRFENDEPPPKIWPTLRDNERLEPENAGFPRSEYPFPVADFQVPCC